MNWYKQSQLEQDIYNKYMSLVQEFINENRNIMYDKVITDRKWAVGACSTVSRDLVKFFIRKGIKSEILGCTGFIPELPDDADEEWQRFRGEGQQYLWHAVVKTEDAIIDLTGGQYGKVFSGIQIKPIDEYLKNWKKNEPYYGKY